MKLKSDNTEQKLRGGYYTPRKIADFLTSWGLKDHLTEAVQKARL